MEVFPVHVELGEEETFRSLLAKVAKSGRDFLMNAFPGTSCVAGTRQLQAVLNYIHAKFEDFAGLPTTSEWVHAGSGDPKHVCRLQVHDFSDDDDFLLLL